MHVTSLKINGSPSSLHCRPLASRMGRRESIRVASLLQRAVACGHGGAVAVPAQRTASFTSLGGGVSRFLSTLAARDPASAGERLTAADTFIESPSQCFAGAGSYSLWITGWFNGIVH